MAASMRLGAVAVAGFLLVFACTPSRATGRPATTSIAGSGSVAALRMIDGNNGWGFGAHRLVRTEDGVGFASIATSSDPAPRFYRTGDGGLTFTALSPRYPGA